MNWFNDVPIFKCCPYYLTFRLWSWKLFLEVVIFILSWHCLVCEEFGMSQSWYFAYNQHHSKSVSSSIEKFLLNWGFENINLPLFSRYRRIHKMLLLSAYGKTKWLIQLIWERRAGISFLHTCLWFKLCQLLLNQLQPPHDSVVATFPFFLLGCWALLLWTARTSPQNRKTGWIHETMSISCIWLTLKILIPLQFCETLWSFLLFNKSSFEKRAIPVNNPKIGISSNHKPISPWDVFILYYQKVESPFLKFV